jgi:hypothetical protein
MKIIASIYFVGSIVCFLWAGISFLSGVPWAGVGGGWRALIGLGGVSVLVIAIILVSLAVGLWKHRNWARKSAIMLPIVSLIIALTDLAPSWSLNLATLFIVTIIPAIYLFFRKPAELK